MLEPSRSAMALTKGSASKPVKSTCKVRMRLTVLRAASPGVEIDATAAPSVPSSART